MAGVCHANTLVSTSALRPVIFRSSLSSLGTRYAVEAPESPDQPEVVGTMRRGLIELWRYRY